MNKGTLLPQRHTGPFSKELTDKMRYSCNTEQIYHHSSVATSVTNEYM